jgi:hypothetical protein
MSAHRLTVALVLGLTVAVAAQAPTLAERAAAIDHVLKEREGQRVVVGHMSRELGVDAETLRAQQTRTGLTWGELLIAHRVARAAQLDLDQIVAEFRRSVSWEDVIHAHGVDLQRITTLIERSETTMEAHGDDRAPRSTAAPPSSTPRGGGRRRY